MKKPTLWVGILHCEELYSQWWCVSLPGGGQGRKNVRDLYCRRTSYAQIDVPYLRYSEYS